MIRSGGTPAKAIEKHPHFGAPAHASQRASRRDQSALYRGSCLVIVISHLVGGGSQSTVLKWGIFSAFFALSAVDIVEAVTRVACLDCSCAWGPLRCRPSHQICVRLPMLPAVFCNHITTHASLDTHGSHYLRVPSPRLCILLARAAFTRTSRSTPQPRRSFWELRSSNGSWCDSGKWLQSRTTPRCPCLCASPAGQGMR